MTDLAERLPEKLCPDASRTVLRPFVFEDPEAAEHPRSARVIDRVMSLDAAGLQAELALVNESLDDRHRDIEETLLRRFDDLKDLASQHGEVSRDQAKLIGAYFTEEFSFESAALFNPSVVKHPDQSAVEENDLRLVISLRGIGEGHISSLAFRTATWKANGAVEVDKASAYAIGPRVRRREDANDQLIVHLLCDSAEEISETVIYPFMPSQGRGIEDLRMVEFTDDDGAVDYRGTYTAFNGSEVRQGLMRTPDFKTFEMRGVRGDLYSGKGMALFPRKIDGRYMMLARQDNENIWLMSSDSFDAWKVGEKIVTPKQPWEFIQMGNCGSPIEVDEGWLVLTHGVGVVRNYCIGACLLDKKDPSKLLGRLSKPLLQPDGGSRDGYVPNVVYSCGAIKRGGKLLIPYGIADEFTGFATVEVKDLIAAMA